MTQTSIDNKSISYSELDLKQAAETWSLLLRWTARLGLSEGVDNHFLMAIPDRNNSCSGKALRVIKGSAADLGTPLQSS